MRLQFLYSIYWCAHSKVENMCRSKGGFYYPKLPLGYEYPTGRAVARGGCAVGCGLVSDQPEREAKEVEAKGD
jgi:hypothetical protein